MVCVRANIIVVQSIAESIKKGQQSNKTHSRTPSNASSTSQEVAQLTATETEMQTVPLNEPSRGRDLNSTHYLTLHKNTDWLGSGQLFSM